MPEKSKGIKKPKRGRKVKIGIIGVGRMGNYHANVLSTLNGDIDFIGVYDIDSARANFIADKYFTRVYETLDHLLEDAEAVCIAVPTKLHFEIAKKALLSGIHTLVEKPVCGTMQEATELVKIASEKKMIFQVGHVERFKGEVAELRRIVKTPHLVEARRLNPWEDRNFDTGVVLDLMIHDIDIVLSLIGNKVIHIDAVGKIGQSGFEDIATAILQFEDGTIANITSSRESELKAREIHISQPEAFVHLNFEINEITILRSSSTSFSVSSRDITYKNTSFIERVKVQHTNALADELGHFAQCILGVSEPIVCGEDDIRTLAIALHIAKKIYEKLNVDLPDFMKDIEFLESYSTY
jgi:predicted dehydrogenase